MWPYSFWVYVFVGVFDVSSLAEKSGRALTYSLHYSSLFWSTKISIIRS